MATMLVNQQPGYTYCPLVDQTSSTRLLTLFPGRDTSKVECLLVNVARPITQPYEALSYEWGELGDTCTIQVNAQPFIIQKNLFRFLLEIRRRPRHRPPLPIWVDAICVNQNDDHEKSQQVRQMHHMYINAATVLVWLGDDLSHGMNELFDYVDMWLSDPRKLLQQRLSRNPLGPEEVRSKMLHCPSIFGLLASDQHWRQLGSLFSCTYWTRAWVQQEVTLARQIVLFAGSCQLPPDRFKVLKYLAQDASKLSLLQCMKGLRPDLDPTIRYLSDHGFPDLDTWYETLCGGGSSVPLATPGYGLISSWPRGPSGGPSLMDLIARHCWASCRDARDRVYAFIGLAAVGGDGYQAQDYYLKDYTQFEVDYAISPVELAVYTVLWCCATDWEKSTEEICHVLEIYPYQACRRKRSSSEESSRFDSSEDDSSFLTEETLFLKDTTFLDQIKNAARRFQLAEALTLVADFLGFIESIDQAGEKGAQSCQVGGKSLLCFAGEQVRSGDTAFSAYTSTSWPSLIFICRLSGREMRWIATAVCLKNSLTIAGGEQQSSALTYLTNLMCLSTPRCVSQGVVDVSHSATEASSSSHDLSEATAPEGASRYLRVEVPVTVVQAFAIAIYGPRQLKYVDMFDTVKERDLVKVSVTLMQELWSLGSQEINKMTKSFKDGRVTMLETTPDGSWTAVPWKPRGKLPWEQPNPSPILKTPESTCFDGEWWRDVLEEIEG